MRCNLIKTIFKFLISTLEFVKLENFIQNKTKKIIINLGPNMLSWVFGLECSKVIVIFVINALQFEFVNLEPKMPYLGVLKTNFLQLVQKIPNTIVIIGIVTHAFVLFQSLV